MTEIRDILPEEYVAAENLMSLCFRYDRTQEPVNDNGHRHEDIYGAFNAQGKMTSCVVGNRFQAYYWGQAVGMCGVGGVCTLPEERHGGAIRRLLELTLERAYDRGDVMASLFPFSHPFYRKFGFETGAPADLCTIQTDALSAFESYGHVRQYMPGQDRSGIERIYEAFAKKRNFACRRTKEMWDRRLEKDPYMSHVYTYIWENDAGCAQAYLTVLHEKLEQGKGFTVTDWAYTTRESLLGVFGFLKRLAPSGNRRTILTMPGGVDPFHLFSEPYGVEIRRKAQGMIRVVNVEKALLAYPWKEGTAFSVSAEDSVLAQNCGTFFVSRRGGKTEVQRGEGTGDLCASIQALSLLLLGETDLSTALECRTDIEINSGATPPEFKRNPIYLREMF